MTYPDDFLNRCIFCNSSTVKDYLTVDHIANAGKKVENVLDKGAARW